MARTPQDITDAELAVLRVLWERGPSAIRAVVDELYPGGGNSELATVQKLCERLCAKRYVQCDRRRRPFSFRARIDRQQLIGRQLKSVADRFCAGSLRPLLSHLVEDGRLSREDIDDLRARVEELDRQRTERRGKG